MSVTDVMVVKAFVCRIQCNQLLREDMDCIDKPQAWIFLPCLSMWKMEEITLTPFLETSPMLRICCCQQSVIFQINHITS